MCALLLVLGRRRTVTVELLVLDRFLRAASFSARLLMVQLYVYDIINCVLSVTLTLCM